jgi:phage baseplate assembly protein W
MAILPETLEAAEIVEAAIEIQPSLTFELLDGRIGGLIDGETAIRQFIQKAIRTARNRFLAYDDEYGCELEDLLGANVTSEILIDEIPRILKDAILYDDRIESVSDFTINQIKDSVFVNFIVTTTQGQTIESEMTF